MKRRNFIKSTGLGTASLIVPSGISGNGSSLHTQNHVKAFLPDKFVPRPIDVKLNIKPVYASRIHEAAYGGPCRWYPMDQMTPEYETKVFQESSQSFFKLVKENLSAVANLMEPLPVVLWRDYRKYENGDMIEPDTWAKIEKEIENIDLFITGYRVPGLEKYKKPVAWVGNGSWNLDWSAFLRNSGVEGYAPYDWDEMRELVKLLQVRKAVRSTRILVVTDRPEDPPVCVLANSDMNKLKEMYGVDYQNISYKEFFAEMDSIVKDKEKQSEAKEIRDKLIRNAGRISMDKEKILNDVNFHLAVKSTMKKYYCNAFTIRCFELCGSHIAAERQFTPCLNNIILRDEGIPSSCEGDINALFTAMTFMYLAKKPAYMGNTLYYAKENRISIHHDAATLKMKGYDQPDLPYEILNFTHESSGGFGTTIRYDFAQDIGHEVTISRANPFSRKIILAKGKIAGGKGLREYGCKLGLDIETPDVRGLFHTCADIGNHLVMVYGDCTDGMRKLGKVLNYEVLEV